MKEFQALVTETSNNISYVRSEGKEQQVINNEVFAIEVIMMPEGPTIIKTRKELYDEIWELSIAGVAKKYDIPYRLMIRQIKMAGIPVPPSGYWMKLSNGKKVSVLKLTGDPAESISIYKTTPRLKTRKKVYSENINDELTQDIPTGLRSESIKISQNEGKILNFLNNDNRKLVLAVSEQIALPSEGSRMLPQVIAHRKKVSKWQKDLKQNEAKGWGKRSLSEPPFLADTISEESVPRVCRIFDALGKSLGALGCKLTDDLRIKVNNDIVYISVTEAKDKLPHILTKSENLELLKYEEERHEYSYSSKPRIPKYDYLFNGRITLKIQYKRTFKDCQAYTVEEKLGDIIIALYETSDILRQEREKREEEERQKEIKRQKEIARRERYNIEAKNTEALVNKANDYEIAYKIRAYISELEKSDEVDTGWIQWAKQKADWYDPTIAMDDACFGIRKHEESSESKALKKFGYSYW